MEKSSVRVGSRVATFRLALAGLLFVSVSPGAAPRYVAVPLPTPDSFSSSANAINASGDVAGTLYPQDGGRRLAFRYFRGAMQDLGTLGGHSAANGISDDGQVAGSSSIPVSQAFLERAFVYSDGSMHDLGALDGANSVATSMSADGQVTGCANTFGKGRHAFRYAGGLMQDLGSPGGAESCGYGINQTGDVTGMLLRDDTWRAFKYSGGAAGVNAVRVFGFEGSRSIGYAINARGQVTGETNCDFDWGFNCHAFIDTDGAMVDLGTLGGHGSGGLALNVRGEVAGYYYSADYSQRAFLYTDGAMYDLNSLVVSGLDDEFTLYEARGINDSGQIAATAWNKDWKSLAFRLDPVPTSPRQAVEYYYGVFDHYFVTADPDEIAKLDNGGFSGWVRTGETFNVWAQPNPSASPTCRFFTTAFAPRSSHFYTPFAAECASVKGDPSWQSEGIAFYVQIPAGYGTGNGSCPDGTIALYRSYNNGMGGAPNHRYTTRLATLDAMIARGWVFEGEASTRVFACVPQ